MNPTSEIRDDVPPSVRALSFLSPGAAGTVLCAFSALFYSLASICLRQMSELQYDRAFQIAIKETVTVLIVAPWLIQKVVRRKGWSINNCRVSAANSPGRHEVRPERCKSYCWTGTKTLGTTWKLVGLMIFAGVLTQLVGNMGQIHSLGTVGLTRTIPVIFAVMLVAGALLGRLFLKERITIRSIGAIAVLIVSILLLQQTAHADAEPVSSSGLLSQGLGAAALSGLTYAILAVTIRYVMKAGMHQGVVMIMTTGIGTLSLGILGGCRTGFAELAQISPEHWRIILASGIFNFLGFLSLTFGLSLTRVTRANVLNSSQVAITATAGVLLFHEPFGVFLACGISLTILGIAMIGRSEPEEFPV